MLSVAGLPQPQEEECSQEEEGTLPGLRLASGVIPPSLSEHRQRLPLYEAL